MIWLDLIKLFAIFLVVFAHCYQQFDSGYLDSPVFLFIYAFHMPLFMMISGFLTDYDKIDSHSNRTLRKRFLQLILPSLLWISIIWIVEVLIGKTHLTFSRSLWYGLWFLKSLFVCTIILIIPKLLFRDKWISLTVSLILCLISVFIPHLWFLQLNVMFPCFVVGIFIRNLLTKNIRHTASITITSSLVFIVCFMFFDKNILYPNMYLILSSEWIGQYPAYLLRIMTGISGSIAVIGIFLLLFQNVNNNIISRLSKYGKYTLEIYILQPLILEVILSHYFDIQFQNFGFYTHLIYFTLSVLIIMCCIGLADLFGLIRLDWTFNFNKFKRSCLKYQS